MSWIMVDVEADGPIPCDYSMISFGAVVVGPDVEAVRHGVDGGLAGFRPFGNFRRVPGCLTAIPDYDGAFVNQNRF